MEEIFGGVAFMALFGLLVVLPTLLRKAKQNS